MGSPKSATTWVYWHQIDFQLILLRVWERMGLVSDIIIEPPMKRHAQHAHIGPEHEAATALVLWAGVLFLALGGRGYCAGCAQRRVLFSTCASTRSLTTP